MAVLSLDVDTRRAYMTELLNEDDLLDRVIDRESHLLLKIRRKKVLPQECEETQVPRRGLYQFHVKTFSTSIPKCKRTYAIR